MRRKQFIQVAGNPLFEKPIHQDTHIMNPLSGNDVFAVFPEIYNARMGVAFPSGKICLKHGRHDGPHSGYGVVHIWTEHFTSEPDVPAATAAVTAYLNNCLAQGASIHYEGALGREKRSMIARVTVGTVIVELRTDAQNRSYYSVVTAIPHGQQKGPRIGGL